MLVNLVSTSRKGYQGRYELESLEQLFTLVKSRGEIIVRSGDNYSGDEPYDITLEVYDDYREG